MLRDENEKNFKKSIYFEQQVKELEEKISPLMGIIKKFTFQNNN